MGTENQPRIESVDALIEDIQEQAAAEIKPATPAHEFMSREAMGRLGCRELFEYPEQPRPYMGQVRGH